MKKILIILLFMLNKLNAAYYPDSTQDRSVNVFIANKSLAAGDTVSSGTQGLCWFKAGFSLTGTGTVTMSNEIPVDREIFLSDRVMLDLHKDLILSGSVRLGKSGNMAAGTGTRLESCLVLTGPFDMGTNTLRFVNGPGFIDGNGNFINFKNGGNLTINAPGQQLLIRNTELRGIRSSRLTPAKGASLGLKDVLLRLDGDYLATTNTTSFNIYGDVIITGTYVFEVNGAFNIYNESSLYFDFGTTLKVGNNALFNFKGTKKGKIFFNGSYIDISSQNFLIDSGAIYFSNEVNIDDNNSNKHFVCGSRNSANILGNASVILNDTVTYSISTF